MANQPQPQIPDFDALDAAIDSCADHQRGAAQSQAEASAELKLLRNIPPVAAAVGYRHVLTAIERLGRDMTRTINQRFEESEAVAAARDYNNFSRMLNSRITKDDDPLCRLRSVNTADRNNLNQPIMEIPLNGNQIRNIQGVRCRTILTALQMELPGNPTVRELRVQVRLALGLISTFGVAIHYNGEKGENGTDGEI